MLLKLGWQWRINQLKIDNSWFVQTIDQWIQWIPQENGQYVPRNIKEVETSGFDIRLSTGEKVFKCDLHPVISYQYVESVTTEAPPDEQYTIGKQLIYTPRSTATGSIRVNWFSYFFLLNGQYSSKRYVDFSNSEMYALEAYALFNVSGGKSWVLNRHRIDINFSVNNIFNEDYQQYSGRAMPGRNYNFKIIYQLNNQHKNEN